MLGASLRSAGYPIERSIGRYRLPREPGHCQAPGPFFTFFSQAGITKGLTRRAAQRGDKRHLRRAAEIRPPLGPPRPAPGAARRVTAKARVRSGDRRLPRNRKIHPCEKPENKDAPKSRS